MKQADDASNDVLQTCSAQIIVSILIVVFLFYVQTIVSEFSQQFIPESTAVFGGLFAGGLHALSGPDHLAAILPLILGKNWANAAFYGSTWGLGHSLSSSMLGALGYFLKDSFLKKQLLPQLTTLADYAVGITLIIIGIMGVLESQHESGEAGSEEAIHVVPIAAVSVERDDGCDDDDDGDRITSKHRHDCEESGMTIYAESINMNTAIGVAETSNNTARNGRQLAISATIFANGFLLGLSWDGLPSLAPTLTLGTCQTLLCFLLAYCAGTVATIGGASVAIAASTKWLSGVTSADLPKRLSFTSSLCAIGIGFLWILQSLMVLLDVTEDEGDRWTTGLFSVSRCLFGVIVLGSPMAVVGYVLLRMMKSGGTIISGISDGWRSMLGAWPMAATRSRKLSDASGKREEEGTDEEDHPAIPARLASATTTTTTTVTHRNNASVEQPPHYAPSHAVRSSYAGSASSHITQRRPLANLVYTV